MGDSQDSQYTHVDSLTPILLKLTTHYTPVHLVESVENYVLVYETLSFMQQ